MSEFDSNTTNRREYIRVRLQIEFCVSPLEHYETMSETEECCSFITKTTDISLGGVCLRHNGSLKAGDAIELRTKNALGHVRCLTCPDVIFMDNSYELQPIKADVVWATDQYAGIKFRKLTTRNENILSKAIWSYHIKNVRDDRM